VKNIKTTAHEDLLKVAMNIQVEKIPQVNRYQAIASEFVSAPAPVVGRIRRVQSDIQKSPYDMETIIPKVSPFFH